VLGNFLIGLREGLEASLIVGILIAYLVKTGRRHLLGKVWAGVGVAVAVSLGFGAILTFGPNGLASGTQELIGGALSILAVGLVTWMIFWMATASRTLAAALRRQVDAAADGAWSLPLIAALAVGREGLETALFVWAATKAVGTEGAAAGSPLLGALLGLAVAAALGWAMYAGAVRINLSRFFAVTGGFLIVVAAGVLANGVHDLQEAGFLPGEGNLAYDVTAAIPPSGLLGTLLKGIFNFSAAATVLEVVVWVGYVAIVGGLFVRLIRRKATPVAQPSPAPDVPARV
jgi:high-affinity iron transporter